MPILLLPLILAWSAIGDGQDASAPKSVTRAQPRAESTTFDPDRPPSWWLDKMQRPCAKVNNRVAC